MKLLLENLPPSLRDQRDTLARCLTAMDAVLPIQQAISLAPMRAVKPGSTAMSIFASSPKARGGSSRRRASGEWRVAMRAVWPRPPFTLVPITPERLAEKRAHGDFFFHTVFAEGVPLATKD